MMMSIHWRKFLTDFLLKKWLRSKAFYHLQLVDNGNTGLDNPDQRIQEDVPSFIRLTLQLAGGLMSTMGQFITMLPLLLILSPDHAFGVFLSWVARVLVLDLFGHRHRGSTSNR